MKVVKLKTFQQMAHFRDHMAPCGADCYPLPPFSTVCGLIHNLCQWTSYHPLDFFISGKGIMNTEVRREWQGGLHFKTVNADAKKRWDIITDDENGSHTGWVGAIKNHAMLADLNLTIYIKADDEDLNAIYKALTNPPIYPSLGEYGDLCDIQSVEIIDLTEYDEPRTGELSEPAYIPVDKFGRSCLGTVYSLNNRYTIVRKHRRFEKVRCFWADKGQKINSKLFDGDAPVVFIE